MKNESVKNSLEKSKKCSRRKAQNGQAKNLHKKTDIFTITIVQEQLTKLSLNLKKVLFEQNNE